MNKPHLAKAVIASTVGSDSKSEGWRFSANLVTQSGLLVRADL
jgi:hypothetical protein